MNRFRPTIRLRLTLLYGSLFLVAGVVLLLVNYTLVRQSLPDSVEARRSPFIEEIRIMVDQQQARGGRSPVPIELFENSDARSLPDVFAAFERDLRQETLDQLVTQSVVALLVTGAIAIVLGWAVAGRVLQPVHQITATARNASQSNLRSRVDLDGPADELKDLADTFDGMLARLETAFESQRRFAAQASHELRTPISVIRAEADVALAADDVTDRERVLAEAVRAEVDRSEALIDGLLVLARSESTLHETETVDLAELVGNVVGELVSLADEHSVEIDLALSEASVVGDRVLLERLVSNLVTNAIIHSENVNGERRWMRVTVGSQGSQTVLSVENSGPDLQDEDLAQFFEPFQRRYGHAGSDRRGVGLGLTIVRSVAETHGGSVACNGLPGGGLDVRAMLPTVR